MKAIPVRQIKSLEEKLNIPGKFSIRKIEEVLNGKDLMHDLHRHDFFFVLALSKGDGVHEIDFVKYKVQDGSVFILRPGQVHRLELKAYSAGFLIEFDLNFYQPKNQNAMQRWKKSSSKNFCEIENARFVKLHSILNNVFEEYSAKQEGYAEAIVANLDLFFLEHVRQSRDPKNFPKSGSAYTQERFEELIQLLEANIGSQKSVSQYADLLNLTSYQLNAITKASVGKTVSDLINEQIILEAKRHLLATSSQIKDVADHLGYEDVSYFIRFFKKHTGYSPEMFRKSFQ